MKIQSTCQTVEVRTDGDGLVSHAGAFLLTEELILDIDATLLGTHSEMERAAGTHRNGFGFFPAALLPRRDERAPGRPLRPGNAGANTAVDHCEILQLALEQLPAPDLEREILARANIGGATHAFTADAATSGIGHSVGYEVGARVREATLAAPESAWQSAVETNGAERGRLGRRADRHRRPQRLARGHPADRAP